LEHKDHQVSAQSSGRMNLLKMLDSASCQCEDVPLLGSLNCNLLNPDAYSGDGRNLIDICDIYNMDCLIDKPTRVSQSSQRSTSF